jgi:ligand-binding SRPBCC domain-containing protein
MQRGAFKSFVHDHYFESTGDVTTMTDVLAFAAPLGFLGRIAEKLVLTRYLERLLASRGAAISNEVEPR